MKKLFSILTTVGLSLTATISTVACVNANSDKNNKDDNEEDLEDKQKNLIINGINDLLSDVKYEGKSDGSTHYTSEKAGLDIIISEADKKPDDDVNKIYKTISDLTKKIRDEKNYIASWDTIEIITVFATNKGDLPENKYAIQNSIKPGEYKWSHSNIKYVEGIVPTEEVNKNAPPDKLLWKMGYLTKESYYVSLFDMAVNNFFNNTKHWNKDNPFMVKVGIEFNKKWINDIVSKIINDKDFETELMTRFKDIELPAYFENKDKISEPMEELIEILRINHYNISVLLLILWVNIVYDFLYIYNQNNIKKYNRKWKWTNNMKRILNWWFYN